MISMWVFLLTLGKCDFGYRKQIFLYPWLSAVQMKNRAIKKTVCSFSKSSESGKRIAAH